VRLLLIALALLLGACATQSGSVPFQPFSDIPVPVQWVPYSRDSVIMQTPQLTVAKLIYFAETKPDVTMEHARQLLTRMGWTETRAERFVNPERFPGIWADFTKGDDICRVTVIEGTNASHVDYVVARHNKPPR